jgi:hypothetical protein
MSSLDKHKKTQIKTNNRFGTVTVLAHLESHHIELVKFKVTYTINVMAVF